MKKNILFSWSGGKDSAIALWELQKSSDFSIVSLLTTITKDYDRISMHGVREVLLERQAESLGLPLHKIFISKTSSNEEYELAMKTALLSFRDNNINAVGFGDIFLEDLKKYRENKLALVNMTALFPIWKRDSAEVVNLFINSGFKAVITCVDTKKLNNSFAGRIIDQDFINDLPEGIDPCGENGEFHSFVFDGPIFKNKIDFIIGTKVMRDCFCFCDLIPN